MFLARVYSVLENSNAEWSALLSTAVKAEILPSVIALMSVFPVINAVFGIFMSQK